MAITRNECEQKDEEKGDALHAHRYGWTFASVQSCVVPEARVGRLPNSTVKGASGVYWMNWYQMTQGSAA